MHKKIIYNDYMNLETLKEDEDYIEFINSMNDFENLLEDLWFIHEYAVENLDKHQYRENEIYINSIVKLQSLYRYLSNILIEFKIGDFSSIEKIYLEMQGIFIITRYIPKHILSTYEDVPNWYKLIKNEYDKLGLSIEFINMKKLRNEFAHENNGESFQNYFPFSDLVTMAKWLNKVSEFIIETTEKNTNKIWEYDSEDMIT